MQVTLSHFSTVPCRLLAMKIFVIGSGTKTHSIGMRHKHLTTCTEGEFKVTKEGYLLFNKSHTKLIYHHITIAAHVFYILTNLLLQCTKRKS